MVLLVLLLAAGGFTAHKNQVQAADDVALTVDAATLVHPFSSMMRGAGFVTWMNAGGRKPGPGDVPTLDVLAGLLRPGIVRFAGGLWANNTGWDRTNTVEEWSGSWTWTNPTTGQSYTYKHVYRADMIDSLAKFARAAGSQVLIQVNVCDNNPAMWADMVHYANVERGYGFRYWELGNELDYSPCGPELDAGQYASRFAAYKQALTAVDAGIQVLGPATARFKPSWISPILPIPADGVTFHWYQSNEGYDVTGCDGDYGPSPDVLFNYSTAVTSCWEGLTPGAVIPDGLWLQEHRRRYAEYALGTLDAMLPPGMLRGITELNPIAGAGDDPLEGNFVAALWFADMLGRLAYHGLDMAALYSLYDDTNYGLIYPDSDSAPTRLFVRPAFYTLFMYGQYFGDQLVRTETSDPAQQLTIWASTDSRAPGTLKLMVVNLSGAPQPATVRVQGFTPTSGVSYQMTNPNPLDSSPASARNGGGTTINGVSIDTTSASAIDASVAAMKPAAVTAAPSFAQTFPPNSVTAIVLTGEVVPAPRPTGETDVVPLAEGCNPVAATWPDGTPIAALAAAILPPTALDALWKFDPEADAWLGYAPAAPAEANDLQAVDRLDAVFACLNAPATVSRPPA